MHTRDEKYYYWDKRKRDTHELSISFYRKEFYTKIYKI